MRSKIVSREHLNELGKDYKLIQFIESKVPVQHFGRTFMVIFSNLIGAIYLTKDTYFVKTLFKKKVILPMLIFLD
jgi:ribonuclease-3